MIRSVGIDLSGTGRHQVRILDEQARLCDRFSFENTLEGLETLERRTFQDGADPTIVFEPTGLAWLPIAIYLRATPSSISCKRRTKLSSIPPKLPKPKASLRRSIS